MFVRVARAFVASTDLLITGPCTIPVILRGAIKKMELNIMKLLQVG